MTAKCMACSAGVSVEEFCKSSKHGRLPGCPKKPTKPRMCCRAMTAKCMACSAGVSVEEFCKHTHRMPGCPAPTKNEVVEHDENAEDDEAADPPLEEPSKPSRPSKFDGPCMFKGKVDTDAPFCHDYDRMWGMPSDYDPQSKTRKYALLEAAENVGEPKDITWVVNLVKKIEKAYPKDNWKTMATRLRKIVYFGKLWDMLIPKAKKVAVLEAKGECTQDVIKALTTPNLNVKDPTGQQIDLNHVWVGIDVANYPTTNLLVRIFGGLKGPAVATWAGDVGSVLGEFYYKTQGEGDIARYYEIMSGDDDMYSNADGYGIALQKLPSGSRNWKLSKRIEYYYQKNINKRVTYMCDAAGLNFKKRGRKKGQLTWNAKRKIRSQIRRFAKLWRIHQCPHGWKSVLFPLPKILCINRRRLAASLG